MTENHINRETIIVRKIEKVIESCKTWDQLMVASNMVENFPSEETDRATFEGLQFCLSRKGREIDSQTKATAR